MDEKKKVPHFKNQQEAALKGQHVRFSESLPGFKYIGRIHDEVMYERDPVFVVPTTNGDTYRQLERLPEFPVKHMVFAPEDPPLPPSLFNDAQQKEMFDRQYRLERTLWLMNPKVARRLKIFARRVALGNRRDLHYYSKGTRRHRRMERTKANRLRKEVR